MAIHISSLVLAIKSRAARREAERFKREGTDKIKKGAREAGDSMDRMNRRMNAGTKAGRGLRRMIGGLTAGFTGLYVIRGVVKTVGQFEESMARLQGVMQIPSELDERFIRLEKSARDMGATTRFSASEAADGLLFLARAGFDVDEAISALPHTLNLASVGAIELGQAADIASNVLSQFGIDAADTERVVDTLVNTANSANTDITQLAEALKLAGPIAGELGLTIEETSAAIGVLGDSGIQASLAGTNLRGVFAALLDPTTKAKNTIEDMGLALEDLDPATNTITEIFTRFRAAGLDAGEAVRIFGRRNAVASLILANAVDKIEAVTEANENATGTSQRQADLINNTLIGTWKSFTSALQEAILASDGWVEGVKISIRYVTRFVRWLAGVEEQTKEAKDQTKLYEQGLRDMSGVLDEATEARDALTRAMERGNKIEIVEAIRRQMRSLEEMRREIVAGEGGAFGEYIAEGTVSPVGLVPPEVEQSVLFINQQIDELKQRLVDMGEAAYSAGRAEEDVAKAVKKAVAEEDFKTFVEARTEALKEEIRVMGLSEEAAEKYAAVSAIIAEAKRKDVEVSARTIRQTLALIDAKYREAEAQERAADAAEKAKRRKEFTGLGETARLERERELMMLSNDERERAILLERARQELRDAGFEQGSERWNQELRALEENIDATQELRRNYEILADVGDILHREISSALSDIVLGTKSWRDAMGDMVLAISEAIVKMLILKSVQGALGSVGFPGFARGAAFHGGSVVPFAEGGIVGYPTYFPMSAGRTGLMGEVPEVIMPLGRDSHGRVGVHGSGGRTVNVSMTVVTQNADSFRKSQRQITADLRRQVEREL